MVSLRLRNGTSEELQRRLFDEHRIELPVFARDDAGPLIRVSIQAYNDESDLDRLVEALAALAR